MTDRDPSTHEATSLLEEARAPAAGLRLVVVGGADQGVSCSVTSRARVGKAADNELTLRDPHVSRHHLEVAPHAAGLWVRDLDSRNGTRVDDVSIREGVAAPGSVIRLGQTDLLVEPEAQSAATIPLSEEARDGALIGRSVPMRRLFTLVDRVAPTRYTVLLEGETGVGKEVVARAIHARSDRASAPFVVFDCASVPPTLLESRLFGHVRGAFTGAQEDRAGAFRRADGGTLLIDELSSLSPAGQAALLRVLETGTLLPVGGDEEVTVDVRVVAATNEPLAEAVEEGRFREDLYYRMSVVTLRIPPLRERREDVALLAERFLAGAGIEGPFAGPALERLRAHGWPGNVRELRNVLERAVALSGEPRRFEDLVIDLVPVSGTAGWPWEADLDRPFKDARAELVTRFERAYLERLLERAEGKVTVAAELAGISRRHLYDLLRKHELAGD